MTLCGRVRCSSINGGVTLIVRTLGTRMPLVAAGRRLDTNRNMAFLDLSCIRVRAFRFDKQEITSDTFIDRVNGLLALQRPLGILTQIFRPGSGRRLHLALESQFHGNSRMITYRSLGDNVSC